MIDHRYEFKGRINGTPIWRKRLIDTQDKKQVAKARTERDQRIRTHKEMMRKAFEAAQKDGGKSR